MGFLKKISRFIFPWAGGGDNKNQPQQNPMLPPGLDINTLNQLIQKQSGYADTLHGFGLADRARADEILGMPLEHYRTLAGGGRTAMSEALAPEVAGINAEMDMPMRTLGLAPRSGVRDLAQGDLEARKQSAISNLLFGKREGAMSSLSGISDVLRNQASQEFGQASGNAQSAAGGVMNWNALIKQLEQQSKASSGQMWGSLGQTIGSLLPMLIGLSDEQMKEDIVPLDAVLPRLRELRGVTFGWKDDASQYGYSGRDAGVIAQDVERAFPELVALTDSGHRVVNFSGLVGMLTEAVKELDEKVERSTGLPPMPQFGVS